MSKKRRTVSLEPQVDELLNKDSINASALVNKLVRNHFTTGGDKKALLELRAEQLQSDIADLESRKETKKEELRRVNSQLEEYREQSHEVIIEALDKLGRTPLEEDNPAIQNWADRADMDVSEFITELEKRR